MGFVRHLAGRWCPAGGISTDSTEGLWQARLRFWQRAWNVQNLQGGQDLVRAAVYYHPRADRTRSLDRLSRLRLH